MIVSSSDLCLLSYFGCTFRIHFDNVTLMLHNVTLTSQKSCQPIKSVMASTQTIINEDYEINNKILLAIF